MTRKEILHWAEETVNHIFHGHHKTETIRGWVARDKFGALCLWRDEPAREEVAWGKACEMGEWIKLDPTLFPQIKWEDEPQEVKITIEL